jgi:CheY-like chemotaxis protein
MGRTRILCVDDNDLVLAATTVLLEWKGYSVVTATNGKSALDAMNQPFDAAVVDYELADMTGLQLARYLKALRPQLPIVLFSGRSDISESTLQEVTAFVPKGSGFQQLLTTLAELIPEAT